MHVGITELRANLSSWVERVRAGEEVVVTDHGVAVARLMPVGSMSVIERLTAEGVISPPVSKVRRKAADIRRQKATGSVSDLVSEQRGD